MRKFLFLFVAIFASAAHAAQPMDAAQLQLALKKLDVVGSVLYVAAHPDDENTAFISYGSEGRLWRTGYLSMTRGDGGQNLLGDEKGELLGVIRTQELLAARRIDGGEQAFTRAIDFGYSKNPQETLAIWSHDTVLADVVWNIRVFQPDVLITRFPTTGEGGHGHHTASAMLAVEAFKLAGDPNAFPDQLKALAPWQPRRRPRPWCCKSGTAGASTRWPIPPTARRWRPAVMACGCGTQRAGRSRRSSQRGL